MNPVILCIGTKEVTGDRLAPLVGTLLKSKYNIPAFVYGDLNYDVNGLRLKETASFVKRAHKGAPLITVDAAIGDKNDIGKIKIRGGGVRPKEAIKKGSRPLGDIGILGVVAPDDGEPLMALMSADEELVASLAERIAKFINFLISDGLEEFALPG
ncbi:MAG: DUF1256 domain-containing protein [Clostridiales bacterium]|nr:DUF1256 domain-containing protein [Clostridiales bacterium]